MPSADWTAPRVDHAVSATVDLPGSKSLTNRYLVVAALAGGTSRLRRPLRSRDTLLMADALRSLGTQIDDTADGAWFITPRPFTGEASVDCGLAGTVMRFLPALAVLNDGPVHFDGDLQARSRPMRPLLDALTQLGADIDDMGRGSLPFTVNGTGGLPGGEVTIDASSSSQYVSALLLAGARYTNGVTVRHVGPTVPSLPHITMTAEVLRDAGAVVDSGPDTWSVEPSPLSGLDVTVEPDLSNAAPFLAAALVTGGRVTVPDWPVHTTQGGDALREILTTMGAGIHHDRHGLVVTGRGSGSPNGGISGVDVDLHETSELTPVVAALAALARERSTIRGVGHIRGHETDRLAALAQELNALGGNVTETADGLVIRPARLHGGIWHTFADHRMVMAGAVLGLAVDDLVIENVATVAKTVPNFTSLWDILVGTPDRADEAP